MATTTDPPRTTPSASRMRKLAILGAPTTLPIAGRRCFPLYGVLHHVGRRSGREYATPVVVRRTDDAVYVPLPFGERTDWYRNALAAGGVRVTWRGRNHWLANPTIVDRPSLSGGFSRVMHGLMDLARIELIVRFDPLVEQPSG